MKKDNVTEPKKPESFVDDPITDILRQGARNLLAEVLKAEVESFLAQYADLKTYQGRQRITGRDSVESRDVVQYYHILV